MLAKTEPACTRVGASVQEDLLPPVEYGSKVRAGDCDWWDDHREAIIIESQKAIAVYVNRSNNVVIRQQDDAGALVGDPHIEVRPEFLPRLIRALQKLM